MNAVFPTRYYIRRDVGNTLEERYDHSLIMSWVDTPNFVVVVARAAMACGIKNACSYAENSAVLFAYEVMSELSTDPRLLFISTAILPSCTCRMHTYLEIFSSGPYPSYISTETTR